MSILELYDDIYKLLGDYLDDKSKLRLKQTCKFFNDKKFCITLKGEYNYFDIVDKLERYIFINVYIKYKPYMNYDKVVKLPEYITNLKFKNKCYKYVDCDLSQDITIYKLPKNLKYFKFGSQFNENIKGLIEGIMYTFIPTKLETLIFGSNFNKDVNGALPKSLIKLKFGCDFNNKIYDGTIPDKVKYLEFGECFDQDIYNKIPESVTHLTFGNISNINIKNKIPNSVTHLTFGKKKYNFKTNASINSKFNQCIKDCIPKSVTHLILQGKFNQNIKGCIPNSVTHLTLGGEFKQDLKGCFHNGLTHLVLYGSFPLNLKGNLPDTITHLTLGAEFNDILIGILPNKLTHLILGFRYNQPLYKIILNDNNDEMINLALPDTLQYVKFGYEFNQPIMYNDVINNKILKLLPNSIKKLTFGYEFNQPIIGGIPTNINKLKLSCEYGSKFNQPIGSKYYSWNYDEEITNIIMLPLSLTHLTFGNYFFQDVRDYISKYVTNITFINNFNREIIYSLPNSVKCLTIRTCYRFDQKYDSFESYQLSLKNGKTHNKCGPYFKQRIEYDNPIDIKYVIYKYDLQDIFLIKNPKTIDYINIGDIYDNLLRHINNTSINELNYITIPRWMNKINIYFDDIFVQTYDLNENHITMLNI